MDKCTECRNRQIGDIPCRACGVGIMRGSWKRPCVLYTCDVCGESLAGASFWYSCEEDKTEYQVEVVMQELSSRQLEQHGISYAVLPQVEYSMYWDCGKR